VNTFAHSSIKLKILSAVILAVLIQAISVGYAINSLERVNFDLNRVVVEQVEKVKLAARMHRNLEEMRVAEKGVLLSTSKEEREQYLGVIKSASGMVQQRSGQLRDLIDKDGKRHVDRFRADYDRYLVLLTHISELATSEDANAAIAMSKTGAEDSANQAAISLVLLVEKVEEDLDNVRMTTDEKTAYARTLLIVLLAIGTLISLIVGFHIAGSIADGLRRLTVVASAIAEGELGTAVVSSSNDELGTLASNIARMQDALLSAQVEEKIQSSRRQSAEILHRSILDSIIDGVIAVDASGMIISCNPAGEQIFGYESGLTIGQNISMLVPELYSNERAGYLARRGAEGEVIVIGVGTTLEGRDKNGNSVQLDIAVSDTNIDGISQYTCILRDITERLENIAELTKAQATAEESSRAKSDFLAIMSHEIRTPMNGVISMLELLQRTPMTADQIGMIDVIHESSLSLLVIINNILDFSKIEAGKMEIVREPMNISTMVNGVGALLENMTAKLGVELKLISDPNLPELVLGDEQRLRQVLINLINNAVKFCSQQEYQGNVEVLASVVDDDKDHYTVEFRVCDNGIGMSESTVKGLFVAFTQGDRSTDAQYGGTGLGLNISHQLITAMAGNISVTSTLGMGSVFVVRVILDAFPSNTALGERITPILEIGASDTLEYLAPPTKEEARLSCQLILVAEDNTVNQIVITSQLEAIGYASTIVNNGEEALSLLKSGDYALLLSDLQMPVLDGYALTKAIRSSEAGSGGVRLPIVALSANAISGTIENCLEVGMDDCLSKPISLAELKATIVKWLPKPTAAVINLSKS
jgi:PAS domain S-box-containing protein